MYVAVFKAGTVKNILVPDRHGVNPCACHVATVITMIASFDFE